MNTLINKKYCIHCKELGSTEFFKNAPKDKRMYSRSHQCEYVKNHRGLVVYDNKLIYEDDDIIVQYNGYFQYSMRVILKEHTYDMMKLFRGTDRAVKKLGFTNPNVYINNHKKKGVFEHPHSWIHLTTYKDCKHWDWKMGYTDGWNIMHEDKARTLQLEPYNDENHIIFEKNDIDLLNNKVLNMSMETLLETVSKKANYFHDKSYYFFIYYYDEKIKRCVVSY